MPTTSGRQHSRAAEKRCCAVCAFSLAAMFRRSRTRVERFSSTATMLAPVCRCKIRSEEHTSELQSLRHLVCRLLLEKKKTKIIETQVHMAEHVDAAVQGTCL